MNLFIFVSIRIVLDQDFNIGEPPSVAYEPRINGLKESLGVESIVNLTYTSVELVVVRICSLLD